MAEDLDVTPQAVSSWIKGRFPTAEKLFEIADYFEIGLDDLIYENLFNVTGPDIVTERPARYNAPDANVEIINIEAHAGNRVESDEWPQVVERIHLPFLPAEDSTGKPFKGFILRGDSMEPTAKAGDVIICEKVLDGSKLINDLLYLVVFRNNSLAFKQVRQVKDRESENYGQFELISHNKTYDNEMVPVDEVEEMYRVVRIMKLKEF